MIIAILQARMSSSRLPGKVLKPILDEPMILRQIERINRSKLINKLIIATSTHILDDQIEQICKENDIDYFRGSLNDVLDRFYQAQMLYKPKHIIRLTGDCPLVDPYLIDQVISFHLAGNYDYTSNMLEPTLPNGLNVEVITESCLIKTWNKAKLPSQREHVTLYIYQNPDKFKIGNFKNITDLSKLRWTVDRSKDLELVSKIYEALYPIYPEFTTQDILNFLEKNPELKTLNTCYNKYEGLEKSLQNDLLFLNNIKNNKNKKVIAIIQARMSSTRLPGKCLLNLAGKTVLENIIERIKYATTIDQIIIATTTNINDKHITDFAKSKGIDCIEGSENDVLDRFYNAAKEFKAEIICRITADDPLKDPQIIDVIVNKFLSGDYDYVSNTITPTYPEGLDVEVFSFKTLEKAWIEAAKLSDREHVTPYIWNNPDIFKIYNVKNDKNLSNMRWTLDYQQDYVFIQEIYEKLYKSKQIFLMKDILELLAKKPELTKINSGIVRNEGYLKSLIGEK